MQRPAFRLSLILVAALWLQPFNHAQNKSPDLETALCSVVAELFAAYAREDLDGYMKLWSAKSPDLAARQKTLQELFTANDKIEVKTLNFRKVNLEGEKASVRVTVDLSALDAKTGKPAQGFGKMNRVLDFVREQGQWKGWKEAAAEENLAAALVAAKTDGERDALLAVEKELMTAELWKALIRQGKRQYSQSNYKQALRIDELAKSIAEQIGDMEGIAQAFNDMGAVQDSQGNYGLAIEYFQRSLVLRKALGDKVNMAVSLANLGSVYGSQGNHRLASEYYQKALVEFELVGHNVGLGAVLNSIGNTYFFQGNYGLALANYEKALKYFQAAGHKAGEAIALNNMGNVRQRQGDYGSALDYYQKSLKVKEALGNKAGIGASLNNIGKNYRLRGRYDLAFEYFQSSLAQFEVIGDARGEALTLGEIGLLHYSKGDYAKALEFAERAAVIAAKMDLREVLWEARTTSGRAYRLLNQPVQARRSFEEAIATVESWRTQVAGGEQEQQRFFEDKVSPYQLMVELLVEQNHAGEALAFAERSKGRVLLDVLRSSRVNITKAMTAQEQEQEARLKNELVALNTQVTRESANPRPDQARLADLRERLQKARLDFEGFQTSLYAAHPELKARRGEAQPIGPEEARELIPDAKSALLEFVVAEEKTYLFTLTKSQRSQAADLKVYVLAIKQKELSERVERFRQQLARRDLEFKQSAIGLYDVLLRPALEQLRNKTTLVIVPDSALWDLPFQVLQPATDRYLIEDYALSYAPSLTVLREMSTFRKRKAEDNATSPTLLAMGNPALATETVDSLKLVHRDEKLGPLPQAELEVKILRKLYGATRSKVYTGAEASEKRIKVEAGNFGVVHLATHGILNDASPMYSHVVLAQSDGASEDGLLEAWEIMKLNLNADLVVLSACESGRGRVGAGEGVIGLTWALFVAGSPTSVVSQWKVESTSTSRLMVEFHRNLQPKTQGPRLSKAKALQKAALKMLRTPNFRHPFYWGGFILVGDGG
jgi:CHAT domain-containing protein/tetratricopeptide (TPR) repeat protein